MTLWLDKYKPTTLDDLDYHRDQAQQLKKLVAKGDFPHLLVYGPSGAGKKTRIHCLLRELYGPLCTERMHLEHREFITASNKKVEICVMSSLWHLEANPSEAGLQDRLVVQQLIKDTAMTEQLSVERQGHFKAVVLHGADLLSEGAQHALRRTMEKYMASCRIIFCAESVTKVIPALRSRCLPVRVAAPSRDSVLSVLQRVCRLEGLELPVELAGRIAEFSEGNLRRALLAVEACHMEQYPFNGGQKIEVPEWMGYIKETAAAIVGEQSPKRLLEVRGRLYELIAHCIPSEVILQRLVDELAVFCDDSVKIEVYQIAAEYEYRMNLGQKAIFHLEAFVAKFMSLYKSYFDDMPMDDDIW